MVAFLAVERRALGAEAVAEAHACRRAELAAIENISERKARYEKMVADAYAWSRALNAATVLEVDDVIDPAETRNWLKMGLNSVPPIPVRTEKKRGWIDTW